jgi:hypothetical protein
MPRVVANLVGVRDRRTHVRLLPLVFHVQEHLLDDRDPLVVDRLNGLETAGEVRAQSRTAPLARPASVYPVEPSSRGLTRIVGI